MGISPNPTGNGTTVGLGDAENTVGQLPPRPVRAAANGARNPSKDTYPDSTHADGSLKPTCPGAS